LNENVRGAISGYEIPHVTHALWTDSSDSDSPGPTSSTTSPPLNRNHAGSY
jgi:hypothetical protein